MEELASVCAWCGETIAEDVEVYGMGARVKPGIDLTDKQGTAVTLSLRLKDKTVPAIVVTNDSEAKRHGYDVALVGCSRECVASLKRALQEEVDAFGEVGSE